MFYPEWGIILIATGKTRGTFAKNTNPSGVELTSRDIQLFNPHSGLDLLVSSTHRFHLWLLKFNPSGIVLKNLHTALNIEQV